MPKIEKKGKNAYVLGLIEPKLGAAITESLEIPCQHTGAVPEILRGIRMHFHNLVKGTDKLLHSHFDKSILTKIPALGFTAQSSGIAQLGLGHSYSRAKVKFNVHRVDNMIIQSIALLDQLDKDINTFSMRIR